MLAIKDLIINALDEAKLCRRSQPAPATLVTSAFELLKKRLDEYSNTEFLSFIRNSTNFTTNKGETLIGSGITDENGVIVTPADVVVDNLQCITRMYYNGNVNNDNWLKLNFVSYEDFFSWGYNSQVYSVLPIDENNVKLYLKSNWVQQNNFVFKVMYNQKFTITLDTVLNIPVQYNSLFLAGLVYDLSVAFPRLGSDVSNQLYARLQTLEENVRASSSVNRIILRDNNVNRISYGSFIGGTFLGI